MEKRLKQRTTQLEKQRQMKQKVDQQEVDTIKNKLLEEEEKSIEVMMIDIDEDKDSPLVRRLRQWMRHRQEIKKEEELRMLSETVINLDAITLKRLIMKLDNLEKGLRELRRIQGHKMTLKIGGGDHGGSSLANDRSKSPVLSMAQNNGPHGAQGKLSKSPFQAAPGA